MLKSRSLSLSILLHAAVLLFAAFGLPAILPDPTPPQPLVMTVELLPISEITNVKPSEKPIQEEKKAPPPKQPVVKAAPQTKEAPKEPPPPKPVEKTFDPDEGIKPPEKQKPVEKPKVDDEQKKQQQKFDDLLKNLTKDAEKPKEPPSKDAKDATNTPKNTTRSDAPYDDSMPISLSEKDAIRSQFIPCWTMPAGAKDAQSLAVRVKVELQPDGTVLSAVIASDQLGRYNSDTFFRAAADSALRAAHKCSPLKNLPPEKYNSWRSMEINFNPQDLL